MNDRPKARRILHVFSTFDLAGPQARFVNLIEPLGPSFEHTVVAMDGRYGAATAISASNFKIAKVQISKSAGLGNRKVIRKCIEDHQPDVILSYNWGAIEWVLFAPGSIRRIHVEEGFSKAEATKQFRRRSLFRRAVFALRKPKLLTVSRGLASIAKSDWNVSESRLLLIPNGVDIRRFSPELKIQNKDFTFRFGTVCGLRPEKRVDRLIKAFARLENKSCFLDIAGDGPLRSELQALARDCHVADRVNFLGHLQSPEKLYGSIHCFVLASDTEQAPFSLLEAMASGLPCIVTDVGDMRSMLPTKTNNWVASSDEDAILACMAKALTDTSFPTTADNNRSHVIAHYSLDSMVAAWKSLLI